MAWPYFRWRGRMTVGVAVRPLAWPYVPGNPMLARLLLTLAPTTTLRETLFAIRLQLAEAALRRLQARSLGPPRVRLAKAEGPRLPQPSLPRLRHPRRLQTRPCRPPPDGRLRRLCRHVLPPDSGAPGTGARRKAAGHCFKCSVGDVTDVPFLDCPIHGRRPLPLRMSDGGADAGGLAQLTGRARPSSFPPFTVLGRGSGGCPNLATTRAAEAGGAARGPPQPWLRRAEAYRRRRAAEVRSRQQEAACGGILRRTGGSRW